jgi:signal transduction histidine kinase
VLQAYDTDGNITFEKETMSNDSQTRMTADPGGATPTPIDAGQIAGNVLQAVQQATGAACLTLSIPAMSPTVHDFSLVRQGCAFDADALRKLASELIEHAMASGQIAQRQATADTRPATLPGRIVVFPLIVQDRAIGTLTAAWDDSPLASFDPASFQSILQVASPALESAQIVQAQQSYIQALENVGRLFTELNLLASASEVVTRLERDVRKLLNAERSAIYLTGKTAITAIKSSGLSPDFVNALREMDISSWLPAHLAEHNAGINSAVIMTDMASMPISDAWHAAFEREGIRAGMMIVLQGHGRILGGIALFYDQPRRPEPQEVWLLEVLGAQAAVALDNIELNVANEQHAEILEQHVAERTQELAIALDKAEDADRLKTQLLSTVSHELRTPLAVIKAHVTTMLGYYDKFSKERQLHYLATIDEETDRLTALINSLLDMSRLEAGHLDITPVRIDPMPLFREVVEVVQTRFVDRTFPEVTPPAAPPIFADPVRVRQVIENLVDNAAKYSPPGTPIEIGVRSWDDAIEFWVKDQGSGLTPEQTRRVFERFYQIAGSNESARSGVGLGLAICRGLVEAMGGRIWCESAGPGTGSRFAFTLPWASEETGSENQAEEPLDVH